MDTSTISREAALIDFTANPGMFGAIVSQANNGAFKVNYAPSQIVARAMAHGKNLSSGATAFQLYQLKHQLSVLPSFPAHFGLLCSQ
jgi:hypothetical protein